MKWLSPYEQELDLAFTEAETILATFPESFRVPALEYLDKFHVLKEKRSKNYICYLLPFWLQEHVGLSPADVRRFTVANIFGMMYYHLIDACMDEPETVIIRQLPLAEFIHLEFIRIYSGYFPGETVFWNYFKQYVSEWAEAVSGERTSDYYHDDPVRMGHKAAPVKLTIAGSLLLANREAEIPRLEQAVDTVLVTLQLLDDWQDWEKDLHEGSYNALVSIVQAELKIPYERRPAPEEIRQAITVHNVLATLAQHADCNHESLIDLKDLVPGLYDFHESLLENLRAGAREIDTERTLLQGGGLEYWLSKNM